jgi:hypothetical protein
VRRHHCWWCSGRARGRRGEGRAGARFRVHLRVRRGVRVHVKSLRSILKRGRSGMRARQGVAHRPLARAGGARDKHKTTRGRDESAPVR